MLVGATYFRLTCCRHNCGIILCRIAVFRTGGSKPRLMIHDIPASSIDMSVAEGTGESQRFRSLLCHLPRGFYLCSCLSSNRNVHSQSRYDHLAFYLTKWSSSPPSLTLMLPLLGGSIIIAPLSSGVLIRFRPFLSQLLQSNSGSIILKKETNLRKSSR